MFSHLKIYINMKAGWKSYSKEWVAFSLLTVSITYAFHISLIRETLVVASLHKVPSNDLFPLYYLHCTCFFVCLRSQPLVVTNVHNSVPLTWLLNLLSVSIVCQTLVEACSTNLRHIIPPGTVGGFHVPQTAVQVELNFHDMTWKHSTSRVRSECNIHSNIENAASHCLKSRRTTGLRYILNQCFRVWKLCIQCYLFSFPEYHERILLGWKEKNQENEMLTEMMGWVTLEMRVTMMLPMTFMRILMKMLNELFLAPLVKVVETLAVMSLITRWVKDNRFHILRLFKFHKLWEINAST